MAMKRVKECYGTETDNNSDHAMAVDRISKLPDPVLYHILSFVPTVDAVRTSLLSRRWRRVWYSVPTLQFRYHAGFNRATFNLFVEKCMKYRLKAMRFIDGSAVTSLELVTYCSPEFYAGLSRWLGSNIIMNNVKELDICLYPEVFHQKPFGLPSAVLNSRSLTRLELSDCVKISACRSVNLPSLKSLSLSSLTIDSESLDNLIIGSPSLERCVMYQIHDEGIHRISSPSLRVLEIDAEFGTVEVNARNLQSLKLICYCDTRPDFMACRDLRDLTITSCKGFEYQISNFPLLENLTLYVCEEFAEMSISCKSLKHFSLHKEFDQELKVAIDAPNLVSFDYNGDMELKMSMTEACRQVKGKFRTWGPSKLMIFLLNINCSWNTVDLHLDNVERALILPQNLREVSLTPWLSLKHPKVKIRGKSTRESEFRNFLERLAPSLKTLIIEFVS